MTCPETISLIPLYLSGEFEDSEDDARASEFRRHLRSCPACAGEVGQQAALDARIRAAVIADPVETAAIEGHLASAITIERAAQKRRTVLRRLGAAAAIAVLGLFSYRILTPHPADGALAAAARDHRMEIVDRQPRRWKTDTTSVNELAAWEQIPTTSIAAFAPSEYHFQRAKLCRLEGRIYLHLVYADSTGARSFSVFLDGKTQQTGNREIYASRSGPEHMAGFSRGKLKVMVVADQPEGDVLQFARHAASII